MQQDEFSSHLRLHNQQQKPIVENAKDSQTLRVVPKDYWRLNCRDCCDYDHFTTTNTSPFITRVCFLYRQHVHQVRLHARVRGFSQSQRLDRRPFRASRHSFCMPLKPQWLEYRRCSDKGSRFAKNTVHYVKLKSNLYSETLHIDLFLSKEKARGNCSPTKNTCVVFQLFFSKQNQGQIGKISHDVKLNH